MNDLFDIRDDDGDDSDDGGCLSELELDRLLAKEDASGALQARADACEHCTARLEALLRARDEHLAAQPPHLAAALIAAAAERQAPARSLWHRLRDWRIVAPLTAALTAALLLVILHGEDTHTVAPDVVRLKGGEQFSVLTRAQDGAFRRTEADERLAVGSELGFRVVCTDHCRLTIAGISERGEAYVVDYDREVPSTQEHSPAFTVSLDDSPGAERFYAVFCQRALDRASLLRTLEAAYPATDGRRPIERAVPISIDDCAVRSAVVLRSR